ncbi:MAG: hypothetical protein C3F07_20210 [Anaerolineales bacterium]|nr:hypothetical protein [Anaerolineae bacterium]PWB69149.1 MAG: hypothetical protein C3F07_20210 [Anaerolineales bacterium]
MKRGIWITILILSLLLSACGAQAAPTADPADVQNTAVAAAFTVVAQTQAAVPTNTPIPPTATASSTPPPTNTPLPLPTQDSLSAVPTTIPTFTAQAPSNSSGGDPCNQPLVSWEGPTANLSITNETKPQGDIVLSLYVVTDLGECGYLYVYGNSFTGPVGQYSAGAFVSGKQNIKVFGSFRITQGSWRIVVRNDKIIALGGCYPNC